MNSKKINTGSTDLISSLPDALLCHILSFLSTRDAALTSVLSKRWRFLLAFVPNLDFDNSIYDYPEMSRRRTRRRTIHLRNSFRVFVDRVMASQGNAPLNKLSLRCIIGSDPSCVDRWILNALERGVLELDLYTSEYNYSLPPQVLVSNTLVTLKVAGRDAFTIDVGEVFLPKLKTLHISTVSFQGESGAAFAKLISGCHALEELVVRIMWDVQASFSLSNPNLKKVIYRDYVDENPKSVSFDTPNLVYLEFTDTVADEYPKVSFDSLAEARICLRMTSDQFGDARELVAYGHGYSFDEIEKAADFLMGIRNVKILYLASDTLEVLAFCGSRIPVFNNLLHLTIESNDSEWEGMPSLLQNCPNLETLIFKGLHYKDTDQCSDISYSFKNRNRCLDSCVCKPWAGTPTWLSSSPVKKLKVLNFVEITDDMDKQVELIKYFVETMPNLEEVILYSDTPSKEDLRMISTQFQKLEVASTKCRIQVVSDNISFSSTVFSSASSSASGLLENTSLV